MGRGRAYGLTIILTVVTLSACENDSASRMSNAADAGNQDGQYYGNEKEEVAARPSPGETRWPSTLDRQCQQGPAGVPGGSPAQSAGNETWRRVQGERQQQLHNYLCDNLEAWKYFTHAPVGYKGIPAIIFRLLPRVMPDIWGGKAYADRTGFFRREGEVFPQGYGYIMSKDQPFHVVNLTCAGCHTGRVQDAQGHRQILVGAPSTTVDTLGMRRKMFETVNDPRWTPESFLAVLKEQKPGWLYGKAGMAAAEKTETGVFMAATADMLESVKAGYLRAEKGVHGMLGSYTYKDDPDLLNGYQPGGLEAFGFASMLQMPADFAELEPQAQYQAMVEILPPQPAVVDIMSVWQQNERNAAQWDGNIRAPLIRNLGAEVGVIGDPALTNFRNAVKTTAFVDALPPPVYPFDVDMTRAARGKKIYDETCAGCHESNRFMGIDAIGTDPGRAIGLTRQARIGLTAALKTACIDKTNPDCQVADEDVLVPRQDNPGYTAQRLDGIWARAPYLHNGSVPTMHHLLVPADRPDSFRRGDLRYDERLLGFRWQDGGISTFATDRPGGSNAGHDDAAVFFGGIDFGKEEGMRLDLIEYLKTL